jgi:hypothetical protein
MKFLSKSKLSSVASYIRQGEQVEWIKSKSKYPNLGFTKSEIKEMLRLVSLEFSEFEIWIIGQTCPLSPDGEQLYFHFDFFRFLSENSVDLSRLVRQMKISMLELD